MKTKKISDDGHEYFVDVWGWCHSDTCWCVTATAAGKYDPNKTHRWDMDYNGNFHHSDSCWCREFMVEKNNEEQEPLDNDGRTNCFWCKKPTVRKVLLINKYDFCEGCQK